MRNRIMLLLALGLAGSTALAAPAASVESVAPAAIRGDVGGLWYAPDNAGQGLQLDVLEGGRAALTWYTFDEQGAPLWLFGLGRVEGRLIRAEVSAAQGGRFATLPSTVPSFAEIGEVQIEFEGCDQARLDFVPVTDQLPAGSVALQRLSRAAGTRCNVQEEFAEQRSFHFNQGAGAFTAVFADLPEQGQDIYELDFAHAALPAPLQSMRGLRLRGHNRSDDLAMLIKAPLRGLQPEQTYRLELALEFATPVPSGCAGVGGSPGESVYLKLGAVASEPQAVAIDEGGTRNLRLNFDFGVQSNGGEQARVVGNMANSQSCDTATGVWELKQVSNQDQPLLARSGADGSLWVVAGTDSAFEGLTEVYFTSLQVRLQPVDEG